MPQKFTFVTVPIGDPDDITVNALHILNSVQVICCEKIRPAAILLKYHKIQFFQGEWQQNQKMPYLFPLHKKSKRDEWDFFEELLQIEKLDFACISDGGSPLFEDPGNLFFSRLNKTQRQINRVGGITSLSHFMMFFPPSVSRFHFQGFLPQDSNARVAELHKLAQLKTPLVLLETPYRAAKICHEIKKVFPMKKILIGLDLTLRTEKIIRLPLNNLSPKSVNKGEFICLIY